MSKLCLQTASRDCCLPLNLLLSMLLQFCSTYFILLGHMRWSERQSYAIHSRTWSRSSIGWICCITFCRVKCLECILNGGAYRVSQASLYRWKQVVALIHIAHTFLRRQMDRCPFLCPYWLVLNETDRKLNSLVCLRKKWLERVSCKSVLFNQSEGITSSCPRNSSRDSIDSITIIVPNIVTKILLLIYK